MLDFHSHILPGIDDGSRNVEMSVEMLQESVRQGMTGIVLTPHFYADQDDPIQFLKRRQGAARTLAASLDQISPVPRLLLGAEVHYYRGMGHSSALEYFRIGESNMVLVEMPFRTWGDQELRDIEDIRSRLGLQVLIAHVERYLSMNCKSDIEALRTDCGALIQSNAEFFLSRRTRRKAIKMLDRGEIHLLGSDCHNMAQRAPNLGYAVEYIEEKLGSEILEEIDARGQQIFKAAVAGVR